MDKKDLKVIRDMQAAENAMKWYGWGSPIGISIFFLTITAIIILIKVFFF